MPEKTSPSHDAWAAIENEKRRDRFIRRVSIAAWSFTFVLLLVFAVAIGVQVSHMLKLVQVGELTFSVVLYTAMPLIVVLGVVSLLIATLSTVGVFLRLRTASLAEIQLRLASLEEMLASRPDSGPASGAVK